MILDQGDIVLVHGHGFVSNAIRFLTRKPGEKRSSISHVGIIVDLGDALNATIVEALFRGVVKHEFEAHLGETLAIYRPINLSWDELSSIRARALRYVGRKYGYMKILSHALDGLLFGAYVFRRLTNIDAWPICSWVVAHAYLAAGKDFGVKAGAAQPDDIARFVESNPDKYVCVKRLGVLTRRG